MWSSHLFPQVYFFREIRRIGFAKQETTGFGQYPSAGFVFFNGKRLFGAIIIVEREFACTGFDRFVFPVSDQAVPLRFCFVPVVKVNRLSRLSCRTSLAFVGVLIGMVHRPIICSLFCASAGTVISREAAMRNCLSMDERFCFRSAN